MWVHKKNVVKIQKYLIETQKTLYKTLQYNFFFENEVYEFTELYELIAPVTVNENKTETVL